MLARTSIRSMSQQSHTTLGLISRPAYGTSMDFNALSTVRADDVPPGALPTTGHSQADLPWGLGEGEDGRSGLISIAVRILFVQDM